MASTVRSLSNHYDILRVPAAASGDEIVEAFAAEMRAARLRPDIPVARLAELSVAYETLRDPAKRRAYDSSLGLDRVPRPIVPSTPAPPEARVAAFIAASLRDPVKRTETQATPDPVPHAAPHAVATDPGGLLIDRNRATIGAGAVGLVVLALAVSLPEKNVDRLAAANAPARAVTVGLPPAAPVRDYVVPAQAPPASADRQKPAPAPKAAAQSTPEPKSADQPPAAQAELAAVDKPADSLAPLSEDVSASTVDTVAQAKLPLPNATIARTIERIGYACGNVASASAVAGASGTFKIICSSGDTYRAAPVGGRYHFRRWDRG